MKRRKSPRYAAAVGYNQPVFSTTKFDASSVDLEGTNAAGFQWYPYRFFGSSTNLASIIPNTDGSMTLLGDRTGPNGQLATVVPIGGGAYNGRAFGGGGYFEATLKFDPQDVVNIDFAGWPSWWSMAVEHMVGLPEAQWPGQPPGYEHFIEADFFEYDISWVSGYYGGVLHDWYGSSSDGTLTNIINQDFPRKVPDGTDFTQYHRYGFLWVPATPSVHGYAKFLFDDVQLGSDITWRLHQDKTPPPQAPWLFSIIDSNHLVLILGTGIGAPMTVKSVNVWQH